MAKKFSKPELSRMINGDIPFDDIETVEEVPQQRLDIAALEKYPKYSRATIQKFIKEGHVTVNGEVVDKANTLIDENDNVVLKEPSHITGEKPPVIYDDENVTVFNKPAGMLSIKKGAFLPEYAVEDFGEVVHRLDRDTSGVIIVAKKPEVKGYLQKQFQERKTHKTYYAVVCGTPKQPHAIIDVPLTRNLKKPTTFIPDKDGREAITEYEIVKSGEKYSLIKLKPRTGRTHQLRIHMAHIGTPILGDPVYNPKGPKAPRMYLHAEALEITIPGKEHGERKIFEAPLPEDFENAIR